MCILFRGEGKQIPNKNPHKTPNPAKTDVIKEENLFPGDCVSSDQFEYSVKGRLLHTRGKEDPDLVYCGVTIFVDHTSNYISVHYQFFSRWDRHSTK